MTKYFEVTNRDGPARIGRLILRGGIDTPFIFDPSVSDVIQNGGNLWLNENIKPDEDHITIQPHIGLPYYTNELIVKEFSPSEILNYDLPSGTVLNPGQDKEDADIYVIAGARSIEGDARAILDSIVKVKGSSKPDTALYLPSIATPENVSLLIYLGVDIVDNVLTTIKAYQGLYLTADGEFELDGISELPCCCEICSKYTIDDLKTMPASERFGLLAKHNNLKLTEEVLKVKQHIRNGMLREYVEKQCRSRPWLTALLRLSDSQFSYIEEKIPTYRSSQLLACSSESQNRVEVRRFAERINTRFRSDGEILLLLPCSAKKPYSTSRSHMAIINALGRYRNFIREVIITSPMGVVPRELELVYPAAHYDVAVTGVWDLEERKWVSDCLRNFIDNNHFKRIIAHVEGPYREVCEQTGREMIFTCDGKLTSEASISSLLNELDKAIGDISPSKRNSEEQQRDMFRKMADYEFGHGSGDMLVSRDSFVKGRFAQYVLFDGREQLCSIIPKYGSLALTIAGARKLKLDERYFVEIDNFVPKGSILAPGVVNADPVIRPGDDVFVKGAKAVAVGKAKMSGPEMVASKRGIAVELRHVEKLK